MAESKKTNDKSTIKKTTGKKSHLIKNKYGLTILQSKFAQRYVISGNATLAYLEAGYKSTGNSASVNASRLLSKDNVQSYINYMLDEIEDKAIAKGDEVLKTLTKILRGQLKDQYSEMPSVKDRIEAGKLLGKRYGLFNDKVEITGEVKHKHTGPTHADALIDAMFDVNKDNASKVIVKPS